MGRLDLYLSLRTDRGQPAPPLGVLRPLLARRGGLVRAQPKGIQPKDRPEEAVVPVRFLLSCLASTADVFLLWEGLWTESEVSRIRLHIWRRWKEDCCTPDPAEKLIVAWRRSNFATSFMPTVEEEQMLKTM